MKYQCDMKVDGIGYLMQIHGMTFPEAAEHVGKAIRSPVLKTVKENTNRRVESPKHPKLLQEVEEQDVN